MGRIDDLGSQNRTFFYNQGLVSSEFNKLFSKTIPTGIYEGGEIERLDDYSFRVHPVSLVIADANISKDSNQDIEGSDIAVRIRTTKITDAIHITTNPPFQEITRCLVVARYAWQSDKPSSIPSVYDPGKGFMDIVVVSEEQDPLSSNFYKLWKTDLILGKLNYYSSAEGYGIHPSSPVDYTRKSWSSIVSEVIQPRLRVRSAGVSEDPSKVYVESGFVRGITGIKEVAGGTPSITPTSTLKRTDYIYIDSDGSIKVEEGVPSSSPIPKPYYGRRVVAEIRRGENRTSIRGDEIFQVATIPISSIEAMGILVRDNESYYTHDVYGYLTVEEALKQIWEKAIDLIVPEEKVFRNPNGTRFERVDKQDGIVIRGRDGGSNSYRITITPTILDKSGTLTLASGDTELSVGKMATRDTEEVITGKKEFRNVNGTSFRQADQKDGIVLKGNDKGNSGRNVTLTPNELSASRQVLLPDADVVLTKGTMLSVEEDQPISGEKVYSTYPKLPAGDPTDESHPIRKKEMDKHNQEFQDHKNLTTGAGQAEVPHGIKQGHDNGFDADKLDGAHKDTDPNLAGNSDNRIPSQKAVKEYADRKLSKSAGSGQQLTGTLYTNALRPDAHGIRNLGTDAVRYKSGFFSETVKSGSFDATSSRKKKKDIEDYQESGLEIIKSLKIVTYKYKADRKEQVHIGVIAEDSPKEILSVDRKGVSLTDSIGVIFKAVQELSARIEELEKGKK